MIRSVAIVGGGIIGTALAHAATRAGLAVTLVEAGEIGTGTTAASFGWANASTKTGDQAYHDLNSAGVNYWHDLYRNFGPDIGMTPTGSVLIVGGDDPQGLADLDRDAARLAEFGYACRMLSTDDLAQSHRNLSLPRGARGLALSRDAVIDGPKAARWFATEAQRHGADIRENCRAQSYLMSESGAVAGLSTASGDIEADAVVLCAGKDCGGVLADLAGYDGFRSRFPLREVPGLILQTPPLPDHLRPSSILWTSVTQEFHMMPTADGGVRMGSDDFDRFATPQGLIRGAERLIARADHWLPGITAAISPEDCHLSIGVRPYPADGQSILGPIPGVPNGYLMATHSGITLAPHLARMMVECLLGRRDIPDQFALDRFAGFQA